MKIYSINLSKAFLKTSMEGDPCIFYQRYFTVVGNLETHGYLGKEKTIVVYQIDDENGQHYEIVLYEGNKNQPPNNKITLTSRDRITNPHEAIGLAKGYMRYRAKTFRPAREFNIAENNPHIPMNLVDIAS